VAYPKICKILIERQTRVPEGRTILVRARYKCGSNVTLTSVRAKIDEHAVMFSSNAVKQLYSYLQTSAGRFPCNRVVG